MNIFFGMSASDASRRFDRMKEKIESDLGIRAHTLSSPDRTVCIGYCSDGGAVLGKAVTDGHCLILSGFLQKPLPSWAHGAPHDDPDVAASYLLSRYLKEGTKFLDGINGQYVVALSDYRESRVYLGCDPGGYRRVFYCFDKSTLLYCSHLVFLNTAFENGLEVDRSLEDFLLGYEFLPWNRTLFRGVSCLASATLLEYADGELRVHQIKTSLPDKTRMPLMKTEQYGEEELVKLLHDEFMLAVEGSCPSTDRVAVLLGGFDSALVASALTRLGKKVETFSFHFKEEGFNQAHTDTLSEFCGTKHTWVEITPDIIKKGLQEYSLLFNQPASQPHYVIQTAHACHVIRQAGFVHCLTGDGCDELFLGYPMVHRRAQMFLNLGVMPVFLVKLLLFLLNGRLFEDHMGHVCRLARQVIRILGQEMPVRGHITNRIFDEFSLKRLRIGECPVQEKHPGDILTELSKGVEHLSPIRLAFHGKSIVGVNKNRNEGASTFSGLSMQSPYNYSRFRNFVRILPDYWSRPQAKGRTSHTGKYILMRMSEVQNMLPPEIIYQAKGSPVTAPVDSWYMTSLKNNLVELAAGLPFPYDKGYIQNLLKKKWAEEIYRDYFTLGRYAFHAISLLVTYASFTKYSRNVYNPSLDFDS